MNKQWNFINEGECFTIFVLECTREIEEEKREREREKDRVDTTKR